MDEKKKPKLAETETETANTPTLAPDPVKTEPAFALNRLRAESAKLFGVSASTFDGATRGLEGEFTLAEIRQIMQQWQNKPIKKEVN